MIDMLMVDALHFKAMENFKKAENEARRGSHMAPTFQGVLILHSDKDLFKCNAGVCLKLGRNSMLCAYSLSLH